MFQTKVTFTERQTPEQRKAHAAHWRRRDAHFRRFNTALDFWRTCGKPVCRRQRSCAGDMHACFEHNWALVADEDKEYWRGCIMAARNTRSIDEVHRAGLAAREAFLKHKERIEALLASSAPIRPADEAQPATDERADPVVRIRRL
jgi:hypothetical protein